MSPGGTLLLLFYGQQGAPPVDTYESLLEAIVATLKADVSALTGGVYYELAPQSIVTAATFSPFAVITVVSVGEDWASKDTNSERPTYDEWIIDVSVYNTGSKVATTIAKAVESALMDADLTFTDGTLLQIAQINPTPPTLDPERTIGGKFLWRATRTFQAVVERLI